MELHEYQAKMLLQRFHVPCVPHFLVGEETSFERLHETGEVLLRPQARGKIIEEMSAQNKAEVEQKAKEFLGKCVVTDESGPEGFLVTKVLLVPKMYRDNEIFLKVGIDPSGDIVVQVKEGDKVFSERVTERKKLFRFQLSRLVTSLKISSSMKEAFAKAIEGVVSAFFQFDAKSIEIAPFIVTEQKSLLAYTVRMSIDENAFYRQKEIRELLQMRQQTERERLTKSSFYYDIGKGKIGCLANGRGLGKYMASAIRRQGGTVGGVLDIGEVCTKENIIAGLHVLIRDPEISVVCLNLLTGLLDGELVVSTIMKTLSTVSGGVIRGRFFLRLEGTNVAGGCLAAASSDILTVTNSLREAVSMAVTASKR